MQNLPFGRTVSFLIFFGLIAGHAAEQLPAPTPRTPSEIPVEYFFRPRTVKTASLNPAGTHMAALAQDYSTDAAALVISDLVDGKVKGMRGNTDLNLGWCAWVNNDRLVFSVVKDNHYAWGLYSAPRDNPFHVTTLNSHDAVEVLGTPLARPDHLLIWVHGAANSGGRDLGVLEIDLLRNQKSVGDVMNVRHSIPIPSQVTGVRFWLRDRAGEVRYALAEKKGESELLRRDDSDHWSKVKIDLNNDEPLGVDTNPDVLFVAHRGAVGGSDLQRLNVADGSRGPSLYHEDKYDLGSSHLRYSPNEQEVLGFTYARQANEQVWLRPEEAALQRSIDAALPENRLNIITSRSHDGNRLLVISSSDQHPGSLYLIDQRSKKLRQLAELAPWLPEQLMAPVRLITFRARDGLKLDGYVTLPLNHDPSRPAPMIVLPHGGPWVRDSWGYDPQSQFFASRGYVVFRPNYRGSSGYTAAISKDPQFEFRKMHDDVTDGVRALVEAKIADPAHLAIVGSSFGGYLSLCGAAFEPGLYKCAVTIAGVFDWETVMKEDRENENNLRYEWLRRHFGDPKQHRETFEAMSPFHAIAQIKAPVFVAHGTEDTNADTSQSRRLVKALKAAGVPHEAMFIPGESHGFAEMKHRVELFTRIEAFLKKNI